MIFKGRNGLAHLFSDSSTSTMRAYGYLLVGVIFLALIVIGPWIAGQFGQARVGPARCALIRGDYARAESLYGQASLLEPDLPIHYERGLALYHLGRYREYIQELTGEPWAGRPGHRDNALGAAYVMMSRYGDAIRHLHKAIDAAPQNAVFHRNLSLALKHTGDWRGVRREAHLADAMQRLQKPKPCSTDPDWDVPLALP